MHRFGNGERVRGPSRDLVIAQPFPDEARLERIAEQPAPPPPKLERVHGIASWQLQGPLPTSVTSTIATDTRARALADVLGDGERRVTESMTCFARELGRFMLAHDAQPAIDLKKWMAARCGVGHTGATLLLSRRGSARAPLFDAKRDREHLEAAAQRIAAASDYGVAVVDDGKQGIMVVAAVQRQVAIDDVAMAPKAGEVVVRGRSSVPIGWVLGFATRGDDGFSRCRPVGTQGGGADAFALACAIDPDDTSANLEVTIAPKGALLGSEVLSLWVSPSGALGDTWTARAVTVPVAGDERGALAWLTAINAVRERLGLRAWTHATAQSELVGGLLPHFVAARDDRGLQDEIALGMLAGWKVDGTISSGDMRFAALPRDVPFDRVVGAAMASPSFRACALAPASATAAVAVTDHVDANASQLALVSYELFEPRDYTAAQEAFLDQLDADRAAKGLPAVRRVGDAGDRAVLDAAADRVRAGESAPMDELEGMLEHFSERAGHTMRGAVYTTLSLDGYRPEFDGPLVEAREIVVITKIAEWRPSGSAWGQHVVYVIFAIPGEGR